MAAGWAAARPEDEIITVPMADGGEGLLDVVADAVGGSRRMPVEVADARGLAVSAEWLLLPDGRAIIESAQACGLSRLAPEQRDPKATTTYGVGQLIAAAVQAGAREVVLGVGGTASVDGGAGMLTALGHRILRADGNRVKIGGVYLADVVEIHPTARLGVPIIAAVDVDTPLLGPYGAVAVFAPQKGAVSEDLPVLERGLTGFADAVESAVTGGPWRDEPGAGAGGGLGFAVLSVLGGELRPGARVVAELVGLPTALKNADVVLTGEGSLDAQTQAGKAPALVAALGRASGAKVYAVAGRIRDGAEAAFDVTLALGPEGLERAAELLEARTAELAGQLEAGGVR